MKQLRLLIGLICLLLVTGGCWDRREIEERNTVLLLAIDRAEPSGSSGDLITVTAQIAIPGAIPLGVSSESGSASRANTTVEVMASTGTSVWDALENLQKRLNQKLFLGHTRVIAISEELAREGLNPHLDAIRRDPEIRRLVWFVVVRGRAADLAHFKPRLEQVPAFYLMNQFDNLVRLGRMGNVFLGEFLIRISNDGEDGVLPLVAVSEYDMDRLGVAVFRDDFMIGRLTPEEEWTKLQIRGVRTTTEPIEVNLAGGTVMSQVYTRSRRWIPRWDGDRLTFRVVVKLEADISEALGRVNFTEREILVDVARALEQRIKENIEALLAKTQLWNADIFGFGENIRAYSPREWGRLSWREVYPTIRFEVEPQVSIRRIGMSI